MCEKETSKNALLRIKHLYKEHLGEYYTKEDEQDFEQIQKELKALEIIKKHCEFGCTIPLPNMKTYYDLLVSELTKKEYNLLKEVLL